MTNLLSVAGEKCVAYFKSGGDLESFGGGGDYRVFATAVTLIRFFLS